MSTFAARTRRAVAPAGAIAPAMIWHHGCTCPGCSQRQWHVGRTTAECASCGTPLLLPAAQPLDGSILEGTFKWQNV